MYTPRAAKVLELAVREALRLGHNYIGTEHILIALVSYEGLGGDVLRELGLTEDRARGEVVHALSGFAPKRSGDAAG
jgi:ATP-dependent Clp protease ATP-binding subunit ClpC